MRNQQEESNGVQGVPTEEVPDGGHVEERLALRPTFELVQDSLPAPGTAAAARPTPAVEPSSPAARSHVSQYDGRLQQEQPQPGLVVVIVTVNQLARQSQLRQLGGDRRQEKGSPAPPQDSAEDAASHVCHQSTFTVATRVVLPADAAAWSTSSAPRRLAFHEAHAAASTYVVSSQLPAAVAVQQPIPRLPPSSLRATAELPVVSQSSVAAR